MAPKHPRSRRAAYLVPLASTTRATGACAYGRVSSDIQREAETIKTQVIKLEHQIRALENPELPVQDQMHLVESFWDNGVSGTVPLEDRPEGQRLVNLICSNGTVKCAGNCRGGSSDRTVDQVWITKLDRLARKLQILIDVEEFLRKHNVALRCLDPGIDTSSAAGRLVFGVLAIIAQWERETILERTTGGKHQKASEGKWVGGRKTFGLTTDENGYLVVDDTFIERCGMAAYEVVQSVFENIALHGSTSWREAQRIGLSDRRVGLMLHNPRYKGEGGIFDKDGKWTDATTNKPPVIVSPELWDLAQQRLLKNRKNASRNRHYNYLLSNILFCHEPDGDGICGRKFIGRTEQRRQFKADYTYYYCSRTMRQPHTPSQHGCTAKMLRAADAEAAVWAAVEASLRNPQAYLEQATRDGQREKMLVQLRAELAQIATRLARSDSERESVVRAAEQGMRDWDEAKARALDIVAETESLQERRTAIEVQIRSMSLDAIDMQQHLITLADMASELDDINATNDHETKTAIIEAVVASAEVRVVDNMPVIRLSLRLGASVDVGAIERRSGKYVRAGSNSSAALPSLPGACDNRRVNEVIASSDIVVAPRKPGPKKRTAA